MTNGHLGVCAAAVAALVGSVQGAAPSGAATLIGSTVTETLYYPTLSSRHGSAAATVGAGIEFPAGAIDGIERFETDVTGDEVVYTVLEPRADYADDPFNGFVLTFAGAPTIAGVTLDTSSSASLSAAPFSFTANSVSFNLSNLEAVAGDKLTLDLTFRPVVGAPELLTWEMMLVGFAALGLTAARTRRTFGPA